MHQVNFLSILGSLLGSIWSLGHQKSPKDLPGRGRKTHSKKVLAKVEKHSPKGTPPSPQEPIFSAKNVYFREKTIQIHIKNGTQINQSPRLDQQNAHEKNKTQECQNCKNSQTEMPEQWCGGASGLPAQYI